MNVSVASMSCSVTNLKLNKKFVVEIVLKLRHIVAVDIIKLVLDSF